VAGILLGIAFILLGGAMLRSPHFGRAFGGASLVLGLVGLVGVFVISIGQDNPNDYAFVIFVTVLPVLLGWKLYSLSSPHKSLATTHEN